MVEDEMTEVEALRMENTGLARRVRKVEHTLDQYHDMIAVLNRQRVDLENKVETLTRTFDIWQEMLGIDVVVVPTVPVFDVSRVCSICGENREEMIMTSGDICSVCYLKEH